LDFETPFEVGDSLEEVPLFVISPTNIVEGGHSDDGTLALDLLLDFEASRVVLNSLGVVPLLIINSTDNMES
jgi:hypothetical protein